jgi:hypothetical protein
MYILKKKEMMVWIGYNRLWIGSDGGLWWTGNEPSGSIISREFLDQLSDYQPLKKDLAS